MAPKNVTDSPTISLAYLPPTPRQRWAVLITALLLIAALVIVAPFAHTPLARINSFIPTLEGVTFVNDLITSILLFAQFSVVRSRAILILASGYLFTALIIVPHALTFPGAFVPNGLLGAGLQTTGWLYFAWHWGTAVTILAYSFLRKAVEDKDLQLGSAAPTIFWTILITICLVGALTWVTTAEEQYLPILFTNTVTGIGSLPFTIDAYTIGVYVPLILAAMALVVLWIRRYSVLDYCVMLVAVAFIAEHVAAFVFTAPRFTLGFYAGRLFSFATSIFVLGFLLQQTTNLYFRLARSNVMLEHERNNRLMNVGATAAAIAHELRQPLAAMVANADASLEFLEQTPPDLLQVKDALNDIVVDGHRTSDALDGIRTLFRNVNEQREPVDVNEISREVLHTMRGELDDGMVTAQTELASEIPLIRGNRNQIQQAIFNLAHNAVEAMVNTAGRSRVLRLITQRDDRNRIVVAVQDTGPGIDPKRLNDIFDAFVTTKSQGTGLGLAICRVIIERHGGELTAFSDGKNGALFQFSLPIESTDEAAART
jgi:signal transduction histidine kinase